MIILAQRVFRGGGEMEFFEALEQAKRGNALLFTGAGFSFGADNLDPDDKGIPSADDLAGKLAKACGQSGRYQLPAIAQYFKSVKDDDELCRILLQTFSIATVADHHIAIAEIPWRRVYTTNYDNCFEFAAAQRKIDWTPITTDTVPSNSANRCVHINGHVAKLTAENLRTQIKLTHSSYSADTFAASRWAQQLRQDITAAKAIFFVGYSMYDLDISRILYEIPELRARTFFVTAPTPDPVSESVLSNYGSVSPIGVKEFSELLAAAEATEDSDEHALSFFRKYQPPTPASPNDASAYDLILKGVISSAMVAWCLGEPASRYSVRRREVDEIVQQLRSGLRWIVVHSDLGNGKSVLKEQLSYVLSGLGFDVYWDSELDLRRKEDAIALSRQKRKIVMLLDDDPSRTETIDIVNGLPFSDVYIVIFLRSTLFQLGEKRYEDLLPDNFAEFDINRLDDGEVSNFSDF